MRVNHAHPESNRRVHGWNGTCGEIYVSTASLKKLLRSVLEQSQASLRWFPDVCSNEGRSVLCDLCVLCGEGSLLVIAERPFTTESTETTEASPHRSRARPDRRERT